MKIVNYEEEFMQRRVTPHPSRWVGGATRAAPWDVFSFLGKLQVWTTVLLLLLGPISCLPQRPIRRPIQPIFTPIYKHRDSADNIAQNQKYPSFPHNQPSLIKDNFFESNQQALDSASVRIRSNNDISKEVELEISGPSSNKLEHPPKTPFQKFLQSFRQSHSNSFYVDNYSPSDLVRNRELFSNRHSKPVPVNILKVLKIDNLESNLDEQVSSSVKHIQTEPEPSEAKPAVSNGEESLEVFPTVVSRVQRDTAAPVTVDLSFERERLAIVDNLDPGTNRSARMESSKHWSNPCRVDTKPNPNNTPAQLSEHIFESVKGALYHVQRFKEQFAEEVFGVGWSWEAAQLEGMIRRENFEFMEPRPVNPTPDELKKLDFAAALQFSYEMMQRRAVAIEAVTLDQALYKDVNQSDLLEHYRKIELEIVGILCELRYALSQQGVEPSAEISSEIMPEVYRDIDSYDGRNARDAVILREYLYAVQYLSAVFSHFSKT